MKLAFDYDVEDYRRYLRVLLDILPEFRRVRTRIRFLLPVALALLTFAYMQKSDLLERGAAVYFLAPVGVVIVAWMLFYPKLYNYRVTQSAMRQIRGEGNRNLFGPREVELSPDGVRTVSRTSEAFFKAEAITKVLVTPEFMLLFIASTQAIIFPRGKIASEEFEKAVEFAKAHYGTQAGA